MYLKTEWFFFTPIIDWFFLPHLTITFVVNKIFRWGKSRGVYFPDFVTKIGGKFCDFWLTYGKFSRNFSNFIIFSLFLNIFLHFYGNFYKKCRFWLFLRRDIWGQNGKNIHPWWHHKESSSLLPGNQYSTRTIQY